jgi:hypothetical protein
MPLLMQTRCLCASLHCGRCTFQCAFWQVGLQYRTSLQPPHSISAPSSAHSAHGLLLQVAAATAAEVCHVPPVLVVLQLLMMLAAPARSVHVLLGVCVRSTAAAGRPAAPVVVPEPSALIPAGQPAPLALAVLALRLAPSVVAPLRCAKLLLELQRLLAAGVAALLEPSLMGMAVLVLA